MQLVLDVFIFLAHHTTLAFVAFGALWWLGPGRWRGGPAGSPAVPMRHAVLITSASTLTVFVLVAVWYVGRAGFAGEVESVVSSLSWQVQSGQPLYTSFDQAERYSVLYGPSVFLTNGLILEFLGPSLVSVKLASAFGAIGCLVFLYASLQRRRGDPVALAAAAGAALYFWAQGFAIYLVRPDALIVFAVAFGLFTATRSRRWLAIIAVGVAAGFTVNLKIHSILYFLPAIVVLAQRHGLAAAVWSTAGAGLVVAAPFVLYPQISAVNYFYWLTNETQHGFQLELLAYPASYVACLGLPVVVTAWLRGRRLGYLGSERALVLSILPALACAMVLSAKPGSGIVHLMPLVPATMYAVGRLFRPLENAELPVWRFPLKQSAAVAVALTVLLSGSVNLYRAARKFAWQLDQMPGIVEDVEGVMDRYEDLPMAMAVGGENQWYRAAWLKPLLVFHDNPVLLDPISVMDTVKSGRGLAAATYAALSEGRVVLWLVPRAQVPFQKMSWYDPDVPIFPPDFVAHFQKYYTRRAQSRYFDLWFWNGLDPAPEAADPAYTLQ